jgi:MarC family membrane protein
MAEGNLLGMELLEFTLLAFSSLFVIVDPISTVPLFLAMTPDDSPRQRIGMARLACWVMTGVLVGFTLLGKLIFQLLGVTLPAFQLAGSVVLLLVALDMLRAQPSRVRESTEETIAGTEKEDIAITPLGVPLLAGPGAISTVILLHKQARDWPQTAALFGCILAVCFITYLILRFSAHGAKWLNPIAMKITTRLMGLLLAAVACQFFVNALQELKIIPP